MNTKERQCICCGIMVTVSKFMSDKVVKCQDCKNNNKEINKDILNNIQAPTKKSTPSNTGGGDTKILPCINCGIDVEVTKFASAAKVLCSNCKGEISPRASNKRNDNEMLPQIEIDISKIDRNVIPPPEQYNITPMLIANQALREVTCPACGYDSMKIIKVLDWSMFGMTLSYQCPHCFLLMTLSEQSRRMVHYQEQGAFYDYTGEKIDGLLGTISHTRLSVATMQLITLLKENNIPIEGIELPPYQFDQVRPVPIGFQIPKGDREIKLIEDVIKILNENGNIEIADKLSELLKVEDNENGSNESNGIG